MAPIFRIFAILNLSLYVAAQGKQFITGACTSDADCGSSCCGFNSGKCAGPVVAQERDGGCGFGDAQPNDLAAQAVTGGATNVNANPPSAGAAAATTSAVAGGATSAAKASGTQFITGACTSDADCASACCGFKSGKCAAALVAQETDGCGFGDAQPNNGAGGAGAGVGAGNANASADAAQGAQAAAAPPAAAGKQFITGACTSDADCGSACCGFNSGKCAGPVVAQERDGGCGFGNAQPNDNAAKALQGRSLGRRGVAFM